MDIQGIPGAYLPAHLPDGLDKGLALNIPDGPADLGDHDVGLRLAAHIVDKPLDLIRDVGDGLYGRAQIRAPALLGDNIGVDLSGGQVGVLIQILVDEPLVMSQIQIRLRPVLGHIDLAMLIGAHGAGVYIDVRIQLLRRHLQSPRLQQPPQGSRRDALSQSGNNAARHKNILCHVSPSHAKSEKEKTPIRGQKSPDERPCSTACILLRPAALCQAVFL